MPKIQAPAPKRPGFGDIVRSAVEGAYGQVRYGVPYAVEQATGTTTPADEQFYKQGLQKADYLAGQAPPASAGDVLTGKVNPVRFVAENIASAVPYILGGAVGAVGGGAVGGPVGAFVGGAAASTPLFAGSNVDRAVQEHGTLTPDAAQKSLLVAPAQSAANEAILPFLPGFGKVFGGTAEKLVTSASGGFIARTAKAMGKAGLSNAAAMAAQTLGTRYAAGDSVSDADAAKEYVGAAVAGLAVGGVLGAGGGFRRTAAIEKPPEAVTPEDLTQHIDAVLDGSARLTPQTPVEHQLGLPLPEGSTTEQQIGLPLATEAPAAEPARPSELPQLPLDPALSAVPPETQLELGARHRDNLTPQTLPETAAVPPETEAALAAIQQPATPPLEASTTLSRGLQGTHPPDITPGIELPPVRLFKDEPIDDLEAALKSKTASPEVKAEAQREIDARRGEAAGNEPLSTDNFQQRVDELKRGLRGGFVQKLEAGTPEELLNKVYDEVFTNQNTQSNVTKFAQRLGILDENLDPGPEAKKLEAQRAAASSGTAGGEGGPVEGGVTGDLPAAPPAAQTLPGEGGSQKIDEAFSGEWQDTLKSAGIQRLRSAGEDLRAPPNRQAAEAAVFRALADDTANPEGGPSQIERLARKMGLVTDDEHMDVTPLGRQAFLRTPEGLQETVAAAQRQGFDGKQASLFDRGVKAQLGGEGETTFSDFKDMAAYQAGKVWADDFARNADTRTAAQTEAIRSRQEARGTARPSEPGGEGARRELAPEQVQQQSLNRLIDAADLRTVSDSDVAELRRMARNGASAEDVGAALEKVQGGKTLFKQPDAERPVVETEKPSRGQPVFKEMNTQSEASKASMRAETDGAAQAYHLRSLIEFAKSEKGITEKRAAKLHDLLDQGKTEQVARLLKDFDPGSDATASFGDRRDTTRTEEPRRGQERSPSGLDYNDPKFEQAIDGKDFHQVLDHIIEHAPSAYHREIMRGAKGLIDKAVKAGAKFSFRVAHVGDEVPSGPLQALAQDRAVTSFTRVPPTATVWVKGADFGDEGGANYQVVAHEMLHAATWMILDAHERGKLTPNSHLAKAAGDLEHLAHEIVEHFNGRVAAGTLSPFEQRYLDFQNNSLENLHEIVSWGLTNPDMQRYLAGIEYTPRQSVWSKFVDLIKRVVGFGADGIEVKDNSALAQLLRVSDQIMQAKQSDLTSVVLRNRADKLGPIALSASMTDVGAGAANRTAAASNDTVKTVAEAADHFVQQLNPLEFKSKMRKFALGWLSVNQLVRRYADRAPSLALYRDAHQARVAVNNRVQQIGMEGIHQFDALKQANAKAADWVNQLMALSTEFQIDPNKAFEDHEHLGWTRDANGDAVPVSGKEESIGRLRPLYAEAEQLKNNLSRGDGKGMQVYNHLRTLNEAQGLAHMATRLFDTIVRDPELRLGVDDASNPMDRFMRAESVTAPDAIRGWWMDTLTKQMAAITNFVKLKRGEAAQGTPNDVLAMSQHLSPVEAQLASIHEGLAAMQKGPYFHLGRFGDYFGSAPVRKLEGGGPDPKALDHIARTLAEHGFGDVQISQDSEKPRISLRFETADQTARFKQVARELHAAGYFAGDLTDVKAAPRVKENNWGAGELPSFIRQYIQRIEADPRFVPDETATAQERDALERQKQDSVRLAVDTWLAQQPDTSISRVLAKRYTVPGYSKDMIRSFSHRWRIGAISLANTSAGPKFDHAYTEARAKVNEAQTAASNEDAGLLTDLLSEMRKRDAMSPVNELADTFDKLRAVSHAYFLGMSPAYGMVNLSQMGVVALPELAKQHGYVNSFHAMRRASAVAFKVIKASQVEVAKLGPKHYADLAITEDVLKKAGLSADERNFVLHMQATGSIEIGSMARQLGQLAEGRADSRLNVPMKYASAVGLYTEAFSRLATALAARELHGGDLESAADYARSVVSNSLFDYETWNTARQLGKRGFMGPVTPIVTQFMQYSVQVTEKIYSEIMDAAGRQRIGETAEVAAARRAASQKFLAGHLAAVTALAGTLGLPFATAFATALERVAGPATGDQNFDASAAWRNFLADVFGKEMGEVLARGAPRALGFDVSQRAGEQNLLPFSEFMSDRRSWKDAVENSAGRSIGAAPSMLVSVLDGGEQMANGDWLAGAKEMLPMAFKGPIEAYRMSTDGYIDNKGNKLPLTPGARDIMWQLLGFSPAEKAEYSEARSDQMGRQLGLNQQASALRQGIVRALISGDQATATDLVKQATTFDQQNPGYAVIPSLAGSMDRLMQSRAQAVALKTPVGVPMQDIAGQGMTQYANVNYTQ